MSQEMRQPQENKEPKNTQGTSQSEETIPNRNEEAEVKQRKERFKNKETCRQI